MEQIDVKIGTRVRRLNTPMFEAPVGEIGTILKENDDMPLIRWDSGAEWYSSLENLELVTNQLPDKFKVWFGANNGMAAKVADKLVELGYKRPVTNDNIAYYRVESKTDICYGGTYYLFLEYSEGEKSISVDDILEIPSPETTRTITIDGKDIEISLESFNELKEQLK